MHIHLIITILLKHKPFHTLKQLFRVLCYLAVLPSHRCQHFLYVADLRRGTEHVGQIFLTLLLHDQITYKLVDRLQSGSQCTLILHIQELQYIL